MEAPWIVARHVERISSIRPLQPHLESFGGAYITGLEVWLETSKRFAIIL
jgi:hypothetical protein